MSIQHGLTDLEAELDRCEVLRLHALTDIVDSSTRELVYESVILRASRAHENFLECTFLSYLVGEPTVEGVSISVFANPRDRNHARRIISSSAGARFLDWSEASEVRKRCEVFFESDSPIYKATMAKSSELAWLKKIRNQAAHDSVESRIAFNKALESVLLISPIPPPSAGEFLQMRPPSGPIRNREILAFLLDALRQFARTAAGTSS